LPDQQKQVLEVGPKNRVPLLNKIISDTYWEQGGIYQDDHFTFFVHYLLNWCKRVQPFETFEFQQFHSYSHDLVSKLVYSTCGYKFG
jgi:hypothetical protein